MATLYVVTAHSDTDVPMIDQYDVASKYKGGSWQVISYGFKRILRKSRDRHFFDDLDKLRAWVRDYVEKRKKFHRDALAKLDKNEVAVRTEPSYGPAVRGLVKV